MSYYSNILVSPSVRRLAELKAVADSCGAVFKIVYCRMQVPIDNRLTIKHPHVKCEVTGSEEAVYTFSSVVNMLPDGA